MSSPHNVLTQNALPRIRAALRSARQPKIRPIAFYDGAPNRFGANDLTHSEPSM